MSLLPSEVPGVLTGAVASRLLFDHANKTKPANTGPMSSKRMVGRPFAASHALTALPSRTHIVALAATMSDRAELKPQAKTAAGIAVAIGASASRSLA